VTAGVLLYGPPAAGKTTITRTLVDSGHFVGFRPLKVTGAPGDEYRATTHEQLDQLASDGELLWDVRLYNARYAFDRPELVRLLIDSHPVVSIGDPGAVDLIRQGTHPATWVIVELWCDLNTAAQRLTARGQPNLSQRLERWHTTPRLDRADLRLNTTRTQPHTVAREIGRRVIAELTSK
jgi:guanylate kinase